MAKRKTAKRGKAKGKKQSKILKTGKRAVTVNISVPKAMLKKIDVAARKKEVSRSSFIRTQLQSSL